MSIEHVDITDPDIHETKGVASATNGTVLSASGGAGVWVAPNTLSLIREFTVLEGSQSGNQLVAVNDVPQNVLFGGAQSGTHMSIDAAGVITVNTAGFYNFKFNLNFGRTSAVGEALIFARLIINGVQAGFVQGVRLPDENTSQPFQADFSAVLPAAATIKVEMYRDSAGAANGGLIAIATTALAGWPDTPSAWVRVTKSEGKYS